MARDLLDLVWLVPLLPLLGAAMLMLAGRRIGEPKAGWLATGMMGLAFLVSVVMFFALHDLPEHERAHISNVFEWLSSGGLHVEMGFLADPLSVTFILFVTGVGTLIHLFAIGYMHGDERFSRFFAYMNLFCASMLILVLGSSFLVTFLGWEGVGLCSYLLISFWFERQGAALAGKKAFITTRVGDVGFMIAMFLIFLKVGSLDYSALGAAEGLASGTTTVIALLLLLGAVGKSAQFPLHFWLPDAMEGPTPVSALIHAATMVTAGVFLVARAHPYFEVSGDAMTVVAWVGAGTALLAATVALVQPDIKRVLAYSTISQIGFMFLALGVGAYAAAIFHVVTHAFFKATLFLGAGSVIHGNRDNQDMRVMGGYRKYLPLTAGAMTIAWLAIAGVPPFSGFWSKDEILTKAFLNDEYGVWLFGLVTAALTGFYMTRLILLVFGGTITTASLAASGDTPDADAHSAASQEPSANDHAPWDPTEPTVAFGTPPRAATVDQLHPPHEAPPTMALPVLALAGLAIVGGFINIPLKGLEFLTEWLHPSFADVHEVHPESFWEGFALAGVSVVVGIVGIALAVALYRKGLAAADRDPVIERLGPMGRVFGHAYYFDAGVSRVVGGPLHRAARWLSDTADARGIDGAVNGVGTLVQRAAGGLRKTQSGLVRNYALWIVIGTAALLLFLLLYAGR
ncbi:MAG: NADH-quinone oxidoreductase subunit L [Actinobacteria bacterium]|nr:NADH-quinone oxidoreductase subunit L [Actinomycetota bacterium]